MSDLRKQIREDIINFIKVKDGAFFGDLVMHFHYPQSTILQFLMELKGQGKVKKTNDGGRFVVVE